MHQPPLVVVGVLFIVALAVVNLTPLRDYLIPDQASSPSPSNTQPGEVRLHAQFARACPAGWRSRTTQFGDGRIGVNTVFRPSPTNSTRDRNILEMYFSGLTGQ